MPNASHVQELRSLVGSRLLLLPGVAAVVRNPAAEILLLRRSDDGEWSLPAGAIEPGESPAAAIVREVAEETGLDVVPERVLGVFGGGGFRHTYPNGDQVEYTVIVFECRTAGGRLHPRDGEALGFQYFEPDSMPVLRLAYPAELFRPDSARLPLFQPVPR